MRMTRAAAWILLVSMLVGTPGGAQTPTPSKPAAPKPAAPKKSAATLEDDIKKYETLLNDVDVSSDPDIRKAVYGKWAEATCESKRIKLQQILGSADAKLSDSVYNACLTRLLAAEGSITPATAGTSSSDKKLAAITGLGSSAVAPGLPGGCSTVPSLFANFLLDKPIARPSPNTDNTYQPPAHIHSVALDPNRSGAEIPIKSKSNVWVGYINRLRYSATLGGVVTPIAAPTPPSSIFPGAAPQASPAKTPAAAGTPSGQTNFILKVTPSKEQFQPAFEQFGECFTAIEKKTTDFQSRLALEEQTLNDARQRIVHQLDSLQPIANSIQEARNAADDSIFPPNEIPSFPIDDVSRLQSLLVDFISRYAEFSDWASTDPHNEAEFKRVDNGANSIKAILEGYLTPPGQNLPVKPAVKPSDAGAGGQTPTPSVTPMPSVTPTPPPTPGSTPKPGNQAKSPKPAGKAAKTPAPGAKPTATASPAPAASPGEAAPPAATPKNDTPDPIIVGSQEVQSYEANREYVKQWIVLFDKVATAPPGFFVETFQAPCNGWFGQGASTQMQLTVVDNVNQDANTPPTAKNLDKVVCQPVLTVTSGLGLSFIPDRTPAFVPAIKKDAQGNPVLDASGNQVVIQTLGFSNSAAVRPAYAMQVDAALWNLSHGIEMHWGLGAMLTAATGGVTTDIITGPAFSFKKRAFFVSPVYDLGLRTTLQNGFTVGQPQGNLTSPPTQQTWKSGFGITITFPFNVGSSPPTTNSTGNNPAPAAANPAPKSGQGGSDQGPSGKASPDKSGGKAGGGSTP